MTSSSFSLSDNHAQRVGGIDRYVIAVGVSPVIRHRTNGQSYYMTYKTRSRAETALLRVLSKFPDAVVYDKRRQDQA